MRVAFVNSMRSMGGGERWLLETADGLRRRGHGVAVAARAGGALAAAAAESGYELLSLPMRGDLDGPGGAGVPGRGRRGSGQGADVDGVGVGQEPGLKLGELGLGGADLGQGLGGQHRVQ